MKGLCYVLFLYNERVVIFYSCILKGLCYYILFLYNERVVLYFILV